MKIWFEALTGKQALLFHYLAMKFEELGHTVLITSRPYEIDRSNGNLDRLGRKHISIGKYGGASLFDKLIQSAKRIIEMTPVILEFDPDILISFGSPDAFRVAFGLGIPAIQINDTPHAVAVGRLTVSLSEALIHSEAIPTEHFSRFGVTKFFTYSGVDEVLWIKNFVPNKIPLEKLNVSPYNYIVVRCEESKAAYFQKMYPSVKPGSTIVVDIIKKLREKNIKLDIIAFPRYPEQEQELIDLGVKIPDASVDTLSLLYYAKLAMTGGGTMGREAALLGTPTIYTFPLELAVSTYVKNQGFPLEHFPDHPNVASKIIENLNTPHMDDNIRIKKLNAMQTPFDGVIKALKALSFEI